MGLAPFEMDFTRKVMIWKWQNFLQFVLSLLDNWNKVCSGYSVSIIRLMKDQHSLRLHRTLKFVLTLLLQSFNTAEQRGMRSLTDFLSPVQECHKILYYVKYSTTKAVISAHSYTQRFQRNKGWKKASVQNVQYFEILQQCIEWQ